MKQPLDLYAHTLRGIAQRELEIGKLILSKREERRTKDYFTIERNGQLAVERFEQAMRHTNSDQGFIIAEQHIGMFVGLYELFMSSGRLLWAEHDQEASRLTPALLQYYSWLATLPHLTEDRLQVFQRIDDVLRMRVRYLTASALSCTGKAELENIAETLNIELVKRYTRLIPGEVAVYHDGWRE